MNCQRALELLLDAEPDELALVGATPLVGHLRACEKCRAVAGRFTAQSHAMAAVAARRGRPVIAPRARPHARPRRVAALGFAAAAGVAVAIGLARSGSAPAARGITEPPATPPLAAAASNALTTARPEVPVVRRRSGAAPRSAPAAVPFTAIAERAVAVSSEPAVASTSAVQNAELTGGVSVAPPAGTRATIFATRNPGMTIVWLQSDDSLRIPR